jgi:pimeloyl-ACP methyl ester carboxylesterase
VFRDEHPLGVSARRIGGLSGAIVLATLGALTLRTIADVRRAETAFPPVGQFAEVDGVRLHYLVKGTGRPVVLLHGNPGFVQDFALGPSNVFDLLATQYRVIAVDRPGHGYSGRPSSARTTPREQARLVHDLLRQLGVERPVLVGHSWGGGLALIYAEQYPDGVTGLVLVSPRGYPTPERVDPVYAVNRIPVIGQLFRVTLLPPVGQRLLARRLANAYAPDPVRADHVAAARALWLRPSQVAATVWDTRNLQTALDSASRRYGEIAIPVVIVVGDHDRGLDESRRLQTTIPGAELRVLPGTGHEIPLTRQSALADAVGRVFALVAPGVTPATVR